MARLSTLCLSLLFFVVCQQADLRAEDSIANALKRARSGDPVAQYEYAKLLFDGEGIPKNTSEAEKWFLLAAEQGHTLSQLQLGKFYVDGRRVPKNEKKALKWFERAAEAGNGEALGLIGEIYLYPEQTQQNVERALFYLKRGADKGDANAQFLLGGVLVDGIFVGKDIDAAVVLLQSAAKAGNIRATSLLGWALYREVHAAKSEGLKQLTKAAEAGVPMAAYQVAYIRMFREEIYRNVAVGKKFLQMAIDKRSPEAFRLKSRMFLGGFNEEKNPEMAEYFMRRAAEAGSQNACYDLGSGYLDGVYGAVLVEEGKYWLEKATKGFDPRTRDKAAKRLSDLP